MNVDVFSSVMNMGGFRIPRAPQYASNPNKYVLGGRIHIETGLLVVIFFSCFREILEIIMTSQEKLYVIDIEFFTALFYDIMNITVMVGVIWTAIYKNPIFLLPYILMQMLFVFIWGMHFVLYFARAIIPSLPENPLLYTDDHESDEYIRLLLLFVILIIETWCCSVVLQAYVYFEKYWSVDVLPFYSNNTQIPSEAHDSFGNPNFDPRHHQNSILKSDDDDEDLVFTRGVSLNNNPTI